MVFYCHWCLQLCEAIIINFIFVQFYTFFIIIAFKLLLLLKINRKSNYYNNYNNYY